MGVKLGLVFVFFLLFVSLFFLFFCSESVVIIFTGFFIGCLSYGSKWSG